ncbi:hypothetical protein JAAARDRAFT_32233 [Jaapia argillacea MUCL 33604]|uniref:RING-type domain-containing protein n=1 Tax=Jaapia argillacea MUCL 33604 TaxID=933084 RepID=A0A067QF38_9AGAM|nr:hypothetical protein JAAARDRAFT_32233 [Jaapia argillacea MUCL 33604]
MSLSALSAPTGTISTPNDDSSFKSIHNISLKLGAKLLTYPARIWSFMRTGVDDMLNNEVEMDHSRIQRLRNLPPPEGYVTMPGPWGFVTSRYAIGLFAMALVLNRIQNIVVPPRHPFGFRTVHSQSRNTRTSIIRTLYHSLFPINLSSTTCRLIFRIPSLYFLSKALSVWFLMLLQAAGLFPSIQWDWLQSLGVWVAARQIEDVCWYTFAAVCMALCVGALTRGLEGHTLSNSSPFNLFGYSFLLHIYSSPLTHASKPQNLPSRPDVHVLITIILPLLQVTMIHTLGIKQTWSQQRLIPTTITSVLTLLHFHSVLWFSPNSYPLLNYLPCLLESMLALVTLLTISLNALTQLLLEGEVTRPLFGHAQSLWPKWDEDFSVALLRLGTASLEATSVAGLGNEVGGVSVGDSLISLQQHLSSSPTPTSSKDHTEYGQVEMNRSGVASISHTTTITTTTKGKILKLRLVRKKGFGNEVRNVKVSSGQGELWVDSAWIRGWTRFGWGVWVICRGFGRLVWGVIRGRGIWRERVLREYEEEVRSVDDEGVEEEEGEGSEEGEGDSYERFLRGDVISDDEEDFSPFHQTRTGLSSSSVSDSDDDDGEGAGETGSLYADLSTSTPSTPAAPLLLAHMTDTSSSPLTRRRYTWLVGGGQEREREKDGWEDVVRERRSSGSRRGEKDGSDGTSESRRNCVVCTVEPRQIICWPCRCLALCDDCRENLASRSSASKHTCPCCRRSVEGYSRIFIP